MEFLTLQDVPKYHRSAISIQDCGLPQKPASQMDSAERMKSSTPPKMATLPGFDEIAKYADHNVEEQAPEKGASPARISYWQTSANPTERPTFNDPFVGAPGLRLTQPMRPPSATGNYTTQNEMKPSFLHSRPPPTYEHRRSSVRSEYEPRMPTLPPMMPQTQTALHGSNPMASRLPGQLLPAPLPVPSHDARRHSEAPYAGYDQYRQRPLWGSEAAAYPCYPPRHDSSVGGPPDPRWPSYVPAAYAYAVDPAQAQATNDSYQRKRRGNLPKEATSQLKQWFQDHSDSPYPNEEQKARLAATTELSIAQISNWFINARRRNPGREAREAARLRNNAHQ